MKAAYASFACSVVTPGEPFFVSLTNNHSFPNAITISPTSGVRHMRAQKCQR